MYPRGLHHVPCTIQSLKLVFLYIYTEHRYTIYMTHRDASILYSHFLNRRSTTHHIVFRTAIVNEAVYRISTAIFHKALNLFKFVCELTLKFVPATNQYQALKAKGDNCSPFFVQTQIMNLRSCMQQDK